VKGCFIQPLSKTHREWAIKLVKKYWKSEKIITRGKIHHIDKLPGFVALEGSVPVGLVIYNIENKECEIITLNSLKENKGIGTELISAVKKIAITESCRRLWLITTNDNIPALYFYQKRGFRIAAVYPGSIKEYRKFKPEIPTTGINGIPIRDEIELEIIL